MCLCNTPRARLASRRTWVSKIPSVVSLGHHKLPNTLRRTATTSAPPPPHKRMASKLILTAGRCQHAFCHCPEGRVLRDDNALSPDSAKSLPCIACQHLMDQHSDERTAPVPMEGSPHQPKTPTQKLRAHISRAPNSPPRLNHEFCPREKTISNLYQRMLQERVVLVRGTPAIGKTAMLTLLFHHIASLEDGPAVYRIASWQEKPESPHLWNWSSYIHSQTYNELDVFHASVSGDRPYALLIDEAQSSYWDLGFWSEFVKGLAQGTWSGASQPHLVMFAAYGSASSLNTVTPPYLSSAQNISLRPDPHSQSPVGLLLDEGEFRDALARKAASKKPPMLYDKHVCKMLFGITQGHAGAMGSLVDSFYNPRYWGEITTAVCQAVASKRCLDEAALESHFANRYICFEALADTTWRRGLPSSDDMRRPHISDLFTYILQEKSLQFTTVTATGTPVAGEENPLSNRERTSPNTFGSTPRPLQSTIKFAHSRGWIHATWVGSSSTGCISYVLPSQLHAWYLSYLLLPSPTTVPLPEIYTAPFDLCWAAIQHFRPSALLAPSCIGPATLPRPHEAIFQDEFYRCAQHVTGNQLMLTPEFGDARGRIDFFLGTPYLWGFELFRFGDRLAEHVGRFAKRGRYTRWVKAGEIAKYVLLNFTTAEENPEVLGDRLAAGKQDKNLYHVVFSEGFTHVQAFDSAFRPVKDRIRLFEGSAIR